ncbi:DUF1294 domain-containing protein [Lysinibacillus sp. HST-98]|uniref:DUF1294 domain-containing protein n=1 Tax=Lysinibacillus TaxID=400634 RepID=UPI0001DA5446|nr:MULTISPECIES: DUF1294 domain-containing protein [Lysinibacillus]EFI69241.1 hypothetical protein BFZC1_05678 [Lysinibacillus fusiformis ZC1]EKU41214.1 hypothetical protein C518_3707 [Lysinibacillus fusiformis ZB2]MBL3728871.1 DUF1294 domain-containing protein [Lysinibacillus sp. HST-98]MBU5252835.1 DUF1294 domain-containing protein [Lysinibacillus capsici]MED4698515.1 DUF1294 domain-containing protein [Lysinibacillus capsici]
MGQALLAYMSIVSIVLLILMGMDKSRAKNHEWRIAERTLFTLAIAGGAVGGVLGMYLFRHKTRHNRFAFGFPLLAAIQIFIIVQLWT